MSKLRDGVGRLASQTEREVLVLYNRYQRGDIDRSRFVALASVVIARARVKGVALADLALTADVIRALRQRTAPLGITPPTSDEERLHRSVTSVLTEDIDYADSKDTLRESQRLRLGRLARDSAAEAAVWAMGVAMIERGIEGWVRITDMDPCPVCSNLADGIVRPPTVTMFRHVGCQCVQGPAFN